MLQKCTHCHRKASTTLDTSCSSKRATAEPPKSSRARIMTPENHDEVQTNANLPEVFPQIRNKPVKFDTREGGFPLFDSRNVVVNTGRLVCLLGLKCFVDPIFGAIVNITNISILPARILAHQNFVLSRTLFK